MNELSIVKDANLITFDDERKSLIKRTIAPTATDDEMALFLHQCQRTGLDPLARQIYFQKYNTKDGPRVSIITAIDGYRLVADRTGVYAGNDDPVFEGKITQQRYQDSKTVPAKAIVTVWKIVGGKRVPFSASVYWEEYYPGDKQGHMWFKMPHVMLAKVAEAAALRKAFPADLSGVYIREEIEQAGPDWDELPSVIEADTGPKWEVVPDSDKDIPGLSPPTNAGTTARPIVQAAPKIEIPPGDTIEDQIINMIVEDEAEEDAEEIDHLTLALEAESLKDFAEAAYHVLDGYDNEFNVVGALTQKYAAAHDLKTFVYGKTKNDHYLQWLADRKAA